METKDLGLFEVYKSSSKFSFLENLQNMLNSNKYSTDLITSDLIDLDLFNEVRQICESSDVLVYFGNTLRDIKLVITSNEDTLEHPILIKYKGPKKLSITELCLPQSKITDQEYATLEDILIAVRNYVERLQNYFNELDQIDRFCTVMEPAKPTFKDDYRRILLDGRTWLHLEVTADGLAKNIHLIGQSDIWQEKLQDGLLNWDHDKDIFENLIIVFDIDEFPKVPIKLSQKVIDNKEIATEEEVVCSICLCAKIPGQVGVPQPLCQNLSCGVFFHRSCLYEWLVACDGGRLPTFGVANGSCPTCLKPIVCNQKDS